MSFRDSYFYIEAMPEAEREHAWALQNTLSRLSRIPTEFTYALALFGNTNNQTLHEPNHPQADMLRAWSRIGAKHGAVILGGVYETFQAIQGELLHKIPYVREHMDTQMMRNARKIFDNAFPKIKLVRADAVHPEFSATPERVAEHSSDDVPEPIAVNSTGLYLSSMIIGNGQFNEYAGTVNGQYVSYPLTNESIENLKRSIDMYIEAFRPAATATEAALFGRTP